MTVRKNNNTIEIAFQYSPELVSFIKSIDGRTYSPATKCWYIPLAGALPAVERLAARGFVIDPDVWDDVRGDQERAREAEALAEMGEAKFETSLPLYPYQRVGAAFMYKIGSGLLGDEVGLGKTVMSLAVCEKVRAEKVLIFAPAAVKWQWASEIEKFMPFVETVVVEGTVDKRHELWKSEARFYIANYELLLRDFNAMNA